MFKYIGLGLMALGILSLIFKKSILRYNRKYQDAKYKMVGMKNPFNMDSPWVPRILTLWAVLAIFIGFVFFISGFMDHASPS